MSKAFVSKRKLKVALLGPIAPYRGGIAQYSNRLFLALEKIAEVNVFSFKRQYPKWLYPGAGDKEAMPQNLKNKNFKYLIDVYSPLSVKKTADIIIAKKCDVMIISWWTFFWQPGFAYIARRAKRKGVKVIYLCHNVFDHDSNLLIQTMSKFFLKFASGYIVHSNDQSDLLRDIFPKTKILKRLHPIYDHYPILKFKPKKRGRLELLFFGFIREYKGLYDLVDALELLNDDRVFTNVVGEVWTDKEKLTQYIKDKKIPNLETNFNYVNENLIADYFNRADVVVMPYKSATGSGVATMAYFYRKPILASRVGGLEDVITEGKTGWLVSKNSPIELAKAIKKIDRVKTGRMQNDIAEFCKENNWDLMAKKVIEFSKEL